MKAWMGALMSPRMGGGDPKYSAPSIVPRPLQMTLTASPTIVAETVVSGSPPSVTIQRVGSVRPCGRRVWSNVNVVVKARSAAETRTGGD